MTDNLNGLFFDKYQNPDFIHKRISDKYRIISCLKHTDERQVYLIRSLCRDEQFILKCGIDNNGELLKREFEIVEKLSQKNPALFVSPSEYFCESNRHFYIREYVPGKTLASIIEKGEKLSQKEIRRIMASICGQVHFLHSQNPPVICRDINPQNIIICDDGTLKIIDFDSFREYDKSASSDTICVGTKEMAAPEQFGYTQTNVRTDIYVLGMLLIYITTGAYDKYSQLPSGLDKIAARSTSFNPEDRYSSALQMKKALESKCPLKAITAVCSALVITGGIFTLSVFSSSDKNAVSDAEITTTAFQSSAETTIASTAEKTTLSYAETTAAPPETTATAATEKTTSASTPEDEAGEAYNSQWGRNKNGSFSYVYHKENGYIPDFVLDEWIPVDWSEIRTIYADVSAKSGWCECKISGIINERLKYSESISAGPTYKTIYFETDGKQVKNPSITFPWAEDGTTINIRNIVFSKEKYTAPECGVWHSVGNGTFTYKNIDAHTSGHTTETFNIDVSEYGFSDLSEIQAIKADIETDGSLAVVICGHVPVYTVSDTLTVDNRKHTLTLKADGKLQNPIASINIFSLTPNANVKIDNIRFITN